MPDDSNENQATQTQTVSGQQAGMENSQTAPSAGGQATAAPGGGQGDGRAREGATGQQAPGQTGQPAGQTVQIKDEDIEARLGFAESPEQRAARAEKQLAASTKEAMRRKKVNDALTNLLKEQRLELSFDPDGIPTGIAPGKGYYRQDGVNLSYSELGEQEQAVFEADPQKAIDLILAKAKSALVHVSPTMERAIEAPSPEAVEAAVEFLADLQDLNGEKRLPTFRQNLPLIQRMLKSQTTHKAVRDFFAQAPEVAMELLSHKVDAERAAVLRQASRAQEEKKRKQEEARQTPSPGSGGGGSPELIQPETPQAAAKAIEDMLRRMDRNT